MTSHRPALVIAHHPSLDLFDAHALERIGQVAAILDHEPIGDWTDPRADALLARVEVILGHWGCAPIDLAVIDRAPNLGARRVRRRHGQAVGRAGGVRPEHPRDLRCRRQRRTGRRVHARQDPVREQGRGVAARRPTQADAAALGVVRMELDELCASADILSIHAPDLPSTRGMVGAQQLAALRTGATVINTARGALLDHEALLEEVSIGRLSAVLDVTDPEPLPEDHPLWSLPNVFITPHLAGSLGTELHRMVDHAVDEIDRWRTGRPARNAVTKEMLAHIA